MPAPYHSIEERLTRYHTGLTNARDVPDLQTRVVVYDEQYTATNTFVTAWKAAVVPYMHLIKLGRIIFKDDYAAYVKLTLNQERKDSFSGWLTQARKFFTNCLADAAVVAKYAQYNSPQASIEAALALVDAAEQANVAQTKETGEAQKATMDRDTKLDTLNEAMSEFYALARLACEDDPQLLEMLEIVVPEGR